MDTAKLKKFAQYARRYLIEQVTVKMNVVLEGGSLARREHPQSVDKLETQITASSREQLVERVAYTWFNRFCALRFMDVNRYTPLGIVSPLEGQFQPEILVEAKMGHIDNDIVDPKNAAPIFALLNGTNPSRDPMQEAYARLFIAACNYYCKKMDYLFEEIDDYTELLIPDDLLSGNSILAYTREALTPEVCEDVEVIGWLYQYYISEKKDEVFGGLKKNRKITPENIPAATQLFTPHWIVRYLVENSLGRLWMLNQPNSRLIEQMNYYIEPEQRETDFLPISSPEELKICDPACGSGHMLVYAFDLLYAIYEEEGYDATEIPGKILANNLYGIEIDERAGELAAFALTMKAQSKYNRFLRRPVKPQICVLEDIHFTDQELQDYLNMVDHTLFTGGIQATLKQFEEASNFGSLIRPITTQVKGVMDYLDTQDEPELLFQRDTARKVRKALEQADYLNPKYHVVVANPPYMGNRGMNSSWRDYAEKVFPDSKADLFAMFMERGLELMKNRGLIAMVTMQSWMFIPKYERVRKKIIQKRTILSMIHLGPDAFDEIKGEVVQSAAYVMSNIHMKHFVGDYFRLINFHSSKEKEMATLLAIDNSESEYRFRRNADTFQRVMGWPVAYWISPTILDSFRSKQTLASVAEIVSGMTTGDNDLYLKYWYEIDSARMALNQSKISNVDLKKTYWFPYNKGGTQRRWYGNNDFVVNWSKSSSFNRAKTTMTHLYLQRCITWSDISGTKFAGRFCDYGFMFDVKGSCAFPSDDNLSDLLAFLNTKITPKYIEALNPTTTTQVGDLKRIPLIIHGKNHLRNMVRTIVRTNVEHAKNGWDSYEASWDFATHPILKTEYHRTSLQGTYISLRSHWREMTLEMQRLEEENNRIFIEAYGLQDELTPDVPLSEITLTCNPHYRYDSKKSDEELEALLLADTMKEFISYAVGCMFGRYALEKPGLILANQGESREDYLHQVPNPSFMPDEDNVIPVLDGDWFSDDITGRFREFLKLTFGEEKFDENLKYIEAAIGKDIRKYFLKDFYSDHIKRYKKRPIYWLFSSSKGSFNALIYMHRYRPDTVSVVLNDYLRDFRAKLSGRKEHLEQLSISPAASPSDITRALKEIEALKKMIAELEDYERDMLYPLATRKIAIDLDDGVKVNYQKFGKALKAIPGLEAKED